MTDQGQRRPCEMDDLIRDYVGDGREYRGHNGTCGNCDLEYSESADEDLSNAHWMHVRDSQRKHWEATTPETVRALAKAMDPEDPMDASTYAERLVERIGALAGLSRTDAEISLRILIERLDDAKEAE